MPPASTPSQVKCAGCGHLRDSGTTTLLNGQQYGPECIRKAESAATFWCQFCGLWHPLDAMSDVLLCTSCAEKHL